MCLIVTNRIPHVKYIYKIVEIAHGGLISEIFNYKFEPGYNYPKGKPKVDKFNQVHGVYFML